MVDVERIRWNRKVFAAVLTSPALVADLRGRAERVAAACGDGYVAEANPAPRRRARAAVIAAHPAARRENATGNTLVRNLGRAGDGQ